MPGGFGGGSTFLPTTLIFLVHLTNFPEWAIPMTKVVPVFSVGDAWNKSQITFTGTFRYWWKKIDDLTWDIYVELYANASLPGHTSPPSLIPLFMDIDLVIVNEHIWEEVDTDKT